MFSKCKVPLLALFCLMFSGCGLDVFDQQFRSELLIPKPAGAPEPIQITKIYTLDADPSDIDAVALKGVSLLIQSPVDSDLTFLSNVKIYFEMGEERVLMAQCSNFDVDVRNIELTVEYSSDLKPHLDGNSFEMIWVITPNRWYSDWPDAGFTLIADLTFEVNANM